MTRRYAIPCLCLCALLACYSARMGDDAIRLVKQTPASALDQTLPKEPFDAWLRGALDVERIDWIAQRGCGDPQGSRSRDLCVTALIPIRPATNVGVVLIVGRGQRLSSPKVDLLFVERTDVSRYREFGSLHELVAGVR